MTIKVEIIIITIAVTNLPSQILIGIITTMTTTAIIVIIMLDGAVFIIMFHLIEFRSIIRVVVTFILVVAIDDIITIIFLIITLDRVQPIALKILVLCLTVINLIAQFFDCCHPSGSLANSLIVWAYPIYLRCFRREFQTNFPPY